MDNIVSVKLDSRYASTLGVWQYDYGQVLRITGPELPPAVEVQFSLDEKSGETLSRVGTTVDGVTEVKIPDELLTHSATSNYRIYVYIYLTDETSGNTKYEITIPVRVRSKPTSPTEDPETDPDLFRETVVAVNASAERAENAASSAMESAASAEETLIEIKRVTDGISEDIENANTAKSELSDMINSAGIKKKELESSIGKAREAKTALDGSISFAGEKQLALDATVEQANAVDASLKEQIGSAEQIQANVEQIAKNKADISSLNEDLEEVKDKKITKFYASNQGETHLADSDNGKIMDMMLYGRSEQKQYKGINLFPPNTGYGEFVEVSIPKGTKVFAITDGTNFSGGNFRFFNADKTENMWFGIEKDTTMATYELRIDAKYAQNLIKQDFDLSKVCLGIGNEPIYEPYVGGIPSPSPEYPQEIKSVGDSGSVAVKVTGKNILDMRKSRESITNSGVTYARNADYSFTRTGTATDSIGNVWMAGAYVVEPNADLSNVFCVLLKGVTYSIKDCVLIARSPDGKALVARNENFVPTQDMYITGVRNENFIINKTYNDIVYPAVYVGAKALQYEPYREQLLTLPYTLNAIPVSSDGNVTIDGQQYIADRVVEKDGVFGIERNIREIHTNTKTMNNSEEYPGWNKVEGVSDVVYYNVDPVGTSRVLTFISNFTQSTLCQNNIKPNNIVFLRRDIIGYSQSELIAKAIDVDMYIRLQDAIFEPLPGDIQAKLRTLVTNYPVTNIFVTSDQLDGYTVFNYPISMANGWNYVKKQLGDTRDYIYDMDAKAQDIDIQSAEAYVNSEYAVALTELEV